MRQYIALSAVGAVTASVCIIGVTLFGLPFVAAVVVTFVVGNLALQSVGRALLRRSSGREELLYSALAPVVVGALLVIGIVGVVAAMTASGEPTFFVMPLAGLGLAFYIHAWAARRRDASQR